MAVIKRLSKVARELNVGISTIVEFLGSQGKEVSANPNTKIDEELYMLLLEEFHKEKFEKEKADKVNIDKPERTVITISKEEQAKSEEKVDKIEAKADKLSGLSVVGKIDLDPKPVKKEPEPEKEVKEPEVKSNDEPKEEISTIKAEAKKLSGPTVLGKINLPVEKEKKKSDGDSDSDSSRRKRKRIKKVNVEKAEEELQKNIRKQPKGHKKRKFQKKKFKRKFVKR